MRLGSSVSVDDAFGRFGCDRRFDWITSDYGFLASKHHSLPVVFFATDTPDPNLLHEHQAMFDDGNSVDLYPLLREGFNQQFFGLVSDPRYLNPTGHKASLCNGCLLLVKGNDDIMWIRRGSDTH